MEKRKDAAGYQHHVVMITLRKPHALCKVEIGARIIPHEIFGRKNLQFIEIFEALFRHAPQFGKFHLSALFHDSSASTPARR